MPHSVDAVRELVLQIERTLTTRRLYHRDSAPYRDASARIYERCRAAIGDEALTIRFGAHDLFFGKQSLLHRPKSDEAFFFALYRDGLRELTFTIDTTRDDLERLLSAFEVTDRMLGPSEDMVSHLWRLGLGTITHRAVDGLGNAAETGDDSDADFRSMVTELSARIHEPRLPVAAASAPPVHYDGAMIRRALDENPAMLQLTESQAAALQQELCADRDEALLDRFIDILLTILRSPVPHVDPAIAGPIFRQLAEGYWNARDFRRCASLLSFARAASGGAVRPESAEVARRVLSDFFSEQRLAAISQECLAGGLTPDEAMRLWELIASESLWPMLLDLAGRAASGEMRTAAVEALRRCAAANAELLTRTLESPDAMRVRSALLLIDEPFEKLFNHELMALTSHPDSSIRIKGLGYAAHFGGPAAIELLLKAMESDPSKPVRLYAFRAIAASGDLPGLAPRIRALIADPAFVARPVWEREKYARLLGTLEPEAALVLFESWIPSKRWFWSPKDLETLELAFRGLAACGDEGIAKVESWSGAAGKPGEIARKVLDSISRAEIGDNTVMRPLPELSKEPLP